MNGIKQGKGIEYDYNHHFKYIGEYLNGKKNGHGKEYSQYFDYKNEKYNEEYNLIFEGKYLNNYD